MLVKTKKSIALTMTLQSDKQDIDEENDQYIFNAIIDAVIKNVNATLAFA